MWSPSVPSSPFGIASLVLAGYLFSKLLRFGHREKHLPPGPPTLPILGNAHLIPSTNFYKKLKEWSDKYGPVYSLKIGQGTFIVLNDRRAVHDTVDKKSALYAERPRDYQMEVSLGNENIAMMHATPLWRAQRKIASQMLAPRRLDEEVAPIQEAETCQLMHDLLETPEDFSNHVKRTTASVATIVMFGFRAKTFESFWAKCAYINMDVISASLEQGTYLPIEQFPILKLIPDRWAPSKDRAKRCYRTTTDTWTEARELVEQRRRNGDYRDSLCDKLLSEEIKVDVPLSYNQLSNFVGAIHQGAADTTASAIRTSILFMSKHPWVQEKAQVELDRVCGTERMPTWKDFAELPYINCIVKESLRIRPIVPSGVPHRAKQDDWYDGMLIPKDATVFIPAWSLHNTCYSAPELYNPDRYLQHPKLANDYAGSPDYEKRDHYAYGAGRRICVGIHLAERTQWRITASLLWGFRILPEVGEDGKEVEVDTEAYQDGFTHQAKEYRVRIVARSARHAEVVRREFAAVENYLRKWE
ncbi:cytochrome P450 oxidoreductase-like protein [Massariosphaeria phaeospora]|uniref:Cytochrome P450 oxidoreductase-like protein n=1 Tax=Massariosphaeria phaeospora TaxID=100035 RepID=A0A7C8IDA2_9PLEO|nr:cytochrome P450 oxidoreductase-like protein [Massariosphaeria phaeospora]